MPPAPLPPQKILLATDLTGRCDRALDRAADLARRWGASLTVLHVLEVDDPLKRQRLDELPSWRRPPERTTLVKAQIERDLREELGDVNVRVEEGAAAAVVSKVAEDEKADLIVIGIAQNELVGGDLLGGTVEKLVRQRGVPLLVVKSRLRPYAEILVATDFSDASLQALSEAARFFPEAAMTLLHAWEVPFSGFLNHEDFRAGYKELEKEATQKFVTRSGLTPEQRSRLKVLIEQGRPESMVRAYMHDRQVDLVAIGTHGSSGIFDVLIGNTAKRILEFAPGDVLLIRQAKPALKG